MVHIKLANLPNIYAGCATNILYDLQDYYISL